MDPGDFERWAEGFADGRRAAMAAWWPLWLAARAGDEPSAFDLLERAALDARDAGERGRTASQTLEPWIRLARIHATAEDLELQGRLVRVAADAHALGAVWRNERAHRDAMTHESPIAALPGGVVVAWLWGPPERSVLDGVLDRLFRRAVATGARYAVVDLSRLSPLDDTVRATLYGIPDAGLPSAVLVVVCGLSDASLSPPSVPVYPNLHAFLAELV